MVDIVGVRIVLAADIEKQAKTLSESERIQVADECAAQIRAESVVDTGSFRDHVEVVHTGGGHVAVYDTDEGAEWIEYGNSRQPAHSTMVGVMSRFGKYSGVKAHGRRR
jgi:hypothetical protein